MLETVLALVVGLLVGSFLNVCIHRMPRDLSVVRPRSFCPACEKMIAWYDNVPVLSYLVLGGRCRHCRARISPRYPIVEALSGVLFLVTVGTLGWGLPALKWCLFFALMVGLMFSDLEERILPDEFTLGGAVAGMVLAAFVPMQFGYAQLLLAQWISGRWLSVAEAVLGAVAAGGLLWLVGMLYRAVRHKEGLGLGDVKMLALAGSFMGFHGALQMLVAASLVGSVTGLIYIRITKKDHATYELPLGTFLGATAILLALWQGPFSSFLAGGAG
jgi:leader peptidase (prepilin peptidase) / N-methyltransferase